MGIGNRPIIRLSQDQNTQRIRSFTRNIFGNYRKIKKRINAKRTTQRKSETERRKGAKESRKTHTRDTGHGKTGDCKTEKKEPTKKYTEFAPVQRQQQQQHEEKEDGEEEEKGEEGAKEAQATGQQPGPVKSKRN